MRLLRSLLHRGPLAAALLALSGSASAAPIVANMSTSGTNTLSVQLLIQCSGALCGFIGLGGAGYNQTQTSTLTGTTGLLVDDTTDNLQFSTDVAGTTDLLSLTGSNITFTGLNALLTGGGTSVTVSGLTAGALNAGLANLAGLDLISPPQAIAFGMSGANALNFVASGVTNAPNIPTIGFGPLLVDSLSTLQHTDPDTDLFPNFAIQNLRGSFQSLSTTVTLGQTIRITLRATFTLNFVGESTTAVPEPASFALVGLGLAAFGLAAHRRKA